MVADGAAEVEGIEGGANKAYSAWSNFCPKASQIFLFSTIPI